jgi:hypothetical protein
VKTSVPARKDMVNENLGSNLKINNNKITTTLAMMKFLTVTVFIMLKKVQ